LFWILAIPDHGVKKGTPPVLEKEEKAMKSTALSHGVAEIRASVFGFRRLKLLRGTAIAA
jgi:hypothetical protein